MAAGPWIKAGLAVLEFLRAITGLWGDRLAYKTATIPMQEDEHQESVYFRKLTRDLKALGVINRRYLKRLEKVRRKSVKYSVDYDRLLEHYDIAQFDRDLTNEEDQVLKEAPPPARPLVEDYVRRCRGIRHRRRERGISN